ncbi:hypothetical protein LCGC14_2562850 [marine sediment metagenome]|uniref:Uncharacterized protein n=1 Tax=marine sediment metagenome TaxID=412755 RepID=A0A0F9DCK9_9ZZZZ
MNNHTAHITIDGKPLCRNHSSLAHGNTPDGYRITCEYFSAKGAKAVAKYLRCRFPSVNIRIKGGPCPIQGDDVG